MMSAIFEQSGRITQVGEVQTIGANGFRKREFILDTEDAGAKYPNPIPFELHKDQCDIELATGPATVRFAINGRAWKGRHFVTLKALSVKRDADQNDAKPMPEPEPKRTGDMQSGSDDDLPF